MTATDIVFCRERLEMYIERFGEARITEKIHKVPGLEGLTLAIARTLLTRPQR